MISSEYILKTNFPIFERKGGVPVLEGPQHYKVMEWVDFVDHAMSIVTTGIPEEDHAIVEEDICNAVSAAQRSPTLNVHVWQYLYIQGVRDSAGYYESSLMGVTWQRAYHHTRLTTESDSPYDGLIPEPRSDYKISEMTIQMAQELPKAGLQYRPKRNGVFFQRQEDRMVGSFAVRAVYERAEFVNGIFWVFDDLRSEAQHDGWTFRPHTWSASPLASDEGMVVLYKNKEIKWKYYPTSEVEIIHGLYRGSSVLGAPMTHRPIIAEVYWNGSSLVWVRERYGKVPRDMAYVVILSSLLHFKNILFPPPASLLPEGAITDGVYWAYPCKDAYAVFPYVPSSLVIAEQIQRAVPSVFEGGSYKEIRSAKATFRFADGSFAVIKEKHKLWDFVGGTIEEGETVKECLAREIWEELGCKLSCSPFATVTRIEEGTLYTSSIFNINIDKDSPALRHFRSDGRKAVVHWLPIFTRKLQQMPLTDIPPHASDEVEDEATHSIVRYTLVRTVYQNFLALLADYPGLLKSDIVQVSKHFISNFGAVIEGRLVNRKVPLVFKLDRLLVGTEMLYFYIYERNILPSPGLPFGIKVKDYQAWKVQTMAKSSCCFCNKPSPSSSPGICAACLFVI